MKSATHSTLDQAKLPPHRSVAAQGFVLLVFVSDGQVHFTISHRFPFQFELVGVVHEPIQYGVCYSRISDNIVLFLNRLLASHDRRF